MSDKTTPQPTPDGQTLGATRGRPGETLGADGSTDNPALQKDPADWTTGQEPMTDAQRSYLDTLARSAGEEISADLSKAEASGHIDRLQAATGRSTQGG